MEHVIGGQGTARAAPAILQTAYVHTWDQANVVQVIGYEGKLNFALFSIYMFLFLFANVITRLTLIKQKKKNKQLQNMCAKSKNASWYTHSPLFNKNKDSNRLKAQATKIRNFCWLALFKHDVFIKTCYSSFRKQFNYFYRYDKYF